MLSSRSTTSSPSSWRNQADGPHATAYGSSEQSGSVSIPLPLRSSCLEQLRGLRRNRVPANPEPTSRHRSHAHLRGGTVRVGVSINVAASSPQVVSMVRVRTQVHDASWPAGEDPAVAQAPPTCSSTGKAAMAGAQHLNSDTSTFNPPVARFGFRYLRARTWPVTRAERPLRRRAQSQPIVGTHRVTPAVTW